MSPLFLKLIGGIRLGRSLYLIWLTSASEIAGCLVNMTIDSSRYHEVELLRPCIDPSISTVGLGFFAFLGGL